MLSHWTPVALSEIIGGFTVVSYVGRKLYYLLGNRSKFQEDSGVADLPLEQPTTNRYPEIDVDINSLQNDGPSKISRPESACAPSEYAKKLQTALANLRAKLVENLIHDHPSIDEQMDLIKDVDRYLKRNELLCTTFDQTNYYGWTYYFEEIANAMDLIKRLKRLKTLDPELKIPYLPSPWADNLRPYVHATGACYEDYLNERHAQLPNPAITQNFHLSPLFEPYKKSTKKDARFITNSQEDMTQKDKSKRLVN